MSVIILDNSIIEENVVIGAGSVVTPSSQLETGYLYFGVPAKKLKKSIRKQKIKLLKRQKNIYTTQNFTTTINLNSFLIFLINTHFLHF